MNQSQVKNVQQLIHAANTNEVLCAFSCTFLFGGVTMVPASVFGRNANTILQVFKANAPDTNAWPEMKSFGVANTHEELFAFSWLDVLP